MDVISFQVVSPALLYFHVQLSAKLNLVAVKVILDGVGVPVKLFVYLKACSPPTIIYLADAPDIQTAELSLTVPLAKVVTVLLHIYLPFTQAGAVVIHEPPDKDVSDVDK